MCSGYHGNYGKRDDVDIGGRCMTSASFGGHGVNRIRRRDVFGGRVVRLIAGPGPRVVSASPIPATARLEILVIFKTGLIFTIVNCVRCMCVCICVCVCNCDINNALKKECLKHRCSFSKQTNLTYITNCNTDN